MAFKLLSKNIVGVVATLFLVVLLTQARLFDFLINTALGRVALILAILGISYCHTIFGVVAILFVIIIFNQSDLSFMEGFTDTIPAPTTDPSGNPIKKDESTTTSSSSAMAATPPTPATPATPATPITPPMETFMGREGFNTVDREGMILRGKRSNEVPVFSNARNQNDDVEPTDKSGLTSSYSAF